MNKIIVISLVVIVLFIAATAITVALKPQLHKTVQFEQIIYKFRSK